MLTNWREKYKIGQMRTDDNQKTLGLVILAGTDQWNCAYGPRIFLRDKKDLEQQKATNRDPNAMRIKVVM